MKVKRSVCMYCGGCVGVCPTNSLELFETELRINDKTCIRCGRCVKFCPVKAIMGDIE